MMLCLVLLKLKFIIYKKTVANSGFIPYNKGVENRENAIVTKAVRALLIGRNVRIL